MQFCPTCRCKPPACATPIWSPLCRSDASTLFSLGPTCWNRLPTAVHCDRVPRGEALRSTPVVLFERAYSPATFDYTVEQLYGAELAEPPIHQVKVTMRAQEVIAQQIGATEGFAPLSKPVADLFRETLQIRPFDPPWFLEGRLVWSSDNMSAALMRLVATAAAERS
jgi:DNA-binding transcriptional LysR family regulator